MPRSRVLAVLLLSLLIFGGKPVVQSIAWMGMIVSYSQEQGLKQAITDTFSGDRPCHLCIKLANEDGKKLPILRQHLDHICMGAVLSHSVDLERVLLFDLHAQDMLLPATALHSWISEPPVPPPRMANIRS
jgi:hypothetical protein